MVTVSKRQDKPEPAILLEPHREVGAPQVVIKAEFVYVLGDLSKISGSEHDPAAWLQHAAQNPSALPRLFVTIGRQEDLYPLNLQFKAACQSVGISLDYYEEDGQHDWLNWNRQIVRFLSKVLEPLPA